MSNDIGFDIDFRIPFSSYRTRSLALSISIENIVEKDSNSKCKRLLIAYLITYLEAYAMAYKTWMIQVKYGCVPYINLLVSESKILTKARKSNRKSYSSGFNVESVWFEIRWRLSPRQDCDSRLLENGNWNSKIFRK